MLEHFPSVCQAVDFILVLQKGEKERKKTVLKSHESSFKGRWKWGRTQEAVGLPE